VIFLHFRVLLKELGPFLARSENISIGDLNNGSTAIDSKGGFKGFASTGFQTFEPTPFMALVERFEELRLSCPDSHSSVYALAWNTYVPSNDPKRNTSQIAYSYHDINVWALSFLSLNVPDRIIT
jgi:hypothetical protein